MAELDAAERKALPKSDFVFPAKAPGPGSYPVPDEDHARDALARVAANGTPEEQAEVRRAVHERFPDLEIEAGE